MPESNSDLFGHLPELRRYRAFVRMGRNPCVLSNGKPCKHFDSLGPKDSEREVQDILCTCGGKAGYPAKVTLADAVECLQEKNKELDAENAAPPGT